MIDVAPVVLPSIPPSANGPLDGMHISVYIDKVTLAMMRQQPSTSVGVDSHLLESVFTSAISGLSGEIQMLERVKGGFLINSFCITDTRNASAKYLSGFIETKRYQYFVY